MPWGEPTALPRGSALGGACHPQASGQVWLCQLNAKETGDGGSRVRALREKNSKTSKECVACALKKANKWSNLGGRSRTDGTNRSRSLNKQNKYPWGDQEAGINVYEEN